MFRKAFAQLRDSKGFSAVLTAFALSMFLCVSVSGFGTSCAYADESDSAAAVTAAEDADQASGTDAALVDPADYAPLVIDEYGLLDSSEYRNLESRCEQMTRETGVGVYLLLTDDLDYYGDGESRDFAIDYFNRNNLGVGSDKSAVLFLIALDTRDYVTITHGDGQNVFTDYRVGKMEDSIVSYLSDNRFVEGCEDYVSLCEESVAYYEQNGEGMSRSNDPEARRHDMVMGIGISLIAGLVIAVFVAVMLRRQLRSVDVATDASNYEVSNSFNLTAQNDKFEGSFISKTRRATDDSSSGGGSFGGSSGGKF